VVNKPTGVASIPGRTGGRSIVEEIRELFGLGSDEKLRLVHRLDRDASGVMVLARQKAAQQVLSAQFANRSTEKVYWALVQGFVSEKGEIDLPLFVDRDRMIVRVDQDKGKPAMTEYRVLERLPAHTLLEVRPKTGRLHQIRVHLAAIGYPLAVDARYGRCKALYLSRLKANYRASARHEERPLIARLTLHASLLAFDHPSGTGRVSFEAPVPKDFRAVLNQMRRLLPE